MQGVSSRRRRHTSLASLQKEVIVPSSSFSKHGSIFTGKPALLAGMTEFNSRRHYRPPSLSESCAHDPDNMVRSLSLTSLLLTPENAETTEATGNIAIVVPVPTRCDEVHVVAISFLVHIFLISIFESLFFFFYISTLEDDGILNTVNSFIMDGLSVCENMTTADIILVNSTLGPYINSTIANGNAAQSLRGLQNLVLLYRAWIYVGAIGGITICVAGAGVYRKLHIPWLRICLENLGLVIMLAIYETLFFTTIIHPYQPVTTQEIERNAIQEAQQTCGLFQSLT
jgi:hypothetical protein